MSLEPIRERQAATTQREHTETTPETPETGSVWWAELGLGAVCCLTAVAVVLAHLSVGPLAAATVTFGTVPMALYLAVAVTLGLTFVHSGLNRAP